MTKSLSTLSLNSKNSPLLLHPRFMWKNVPLWILFFSAFLSWAAWGLVINKTSPVESANIAVPAFYITSFCSLMTTFAVVGSLMRKFSNPHTKILRCINISLRQGAILSTVCVVGIFFQQMRTFTWWIGILLLCIGIILESLFWETSSKKTPE